jgi:hypothetical protein
VVDMEKLMYEEYKKLHFAYKNKINTDIKVLVFMKNLKITWSLHKTILANHGG